jgi:hypothetical protein
MCFQKFLAFLIAVSLGAGVSRAQGPSSLPRVVNLAAVGLASTETAQVNVVNLAASVQSVTPGSTPADGVKALCTGGVTFYNSSGDITTSSPSFAIGSGQIFSATLPYSETLPANGTSSARTAVWATVTIGGNNTANACAPAANIETFDTATGVAHLHVEAGTLALPTFRSPIAQASGATGAR